MRGAQAAHELEDGVRQRPLVGHAALDALGHELLGVLLEVAVLAALGHGGEGTHAAIDLEGAALIDLHRARALLRAGEEAAEHHGAGAGGDGLGDVAGVLDAAVGDDGLAVAGRPPRRSP